MNLLDFAVDAALAGLGDGPRARRRGRRGAGRVRADRPGAAGRVPRRRRPRRRARRRPGRGRASRPPPRSSGCATSRRCRPSSSGSRRPAPDGVAVSGRDASGSSRAAAATSRRPGLLIVGAAEVATLAGGLRRGAAQGDVGRLDAGAGRRTRRAGRARSSPAGRAGSSRSGRAAEVEAALEAEGYPLARFARLDAAGGVVTPGLVDPHTHLLFAGSREGELRPPPARRRLPRDPRGRRRDPVHGRRDPRGVGARTLAAHGRRWLDEMLGHGVTTIEAKSGYGLDLETELRLLEVAYRLGQRGPGRRRADVPRRPRRPARVPGPARTATEAYVRSRHRGAAARRRGPGPGPVLRRLLRGAACSRADQSRRILEAAARATAWRRASTPTSWRRRAARSSRPSSGALSADHLAAPSTAGIDALAAAAADGPAGRRDAPAGDDLVPHEGRTTRRPGRFIERGRPGRPRHGLQPGHLADGRACRWR